MEGQRLRQQRRKRSGRSNRMQGNTATVKSGEVPSGPGTGIAVFRRTKETRDSAAWPKEGVKRVGPGQQEGMHHSTKVKAET